MYYFLKIRSPPYSPDLNPIELVWADMKRFIRKSPLSSPKDIVTAISKFHTTITPDYCQNFIQNLNKIIQIVIERNGGWSDYWIQKKSKSLASINFTLPLKNIDLPKRYFIKQQGIYIGWFVQWISKFDRKAKSYGAN